MNSRRRPNTRKDSTAGSPRGPARFSVAAPDVQKQGAAAPIQGRGSLLRLQKGAGPHIPGTFLFPSCLHCPDGHADKKKEIERRSRKLFPASNLNRIPGVSSERPLHRTHPGCLRRGIETRRAKCSSNRHKQRGPAAAIPTPNVNMAYHIRSDGEFNELPADGEWKSGDSNRA